MTFLKPHYTIGKTDFGGQVFAIYHIRRVLVSAPCVVHEEPKHLHRIKYGGWTFGLFGVNFWISVGWK